MFSQQVVNQPLKNSFEYIRPLLVGSYRPIQWYYKLDGQLARFEFENKG